MLYRSAEQDINLFTDLFFWYRYVRALGAFYLRLTGRSKEIYQYLEPLLNDYRKLRVRTGGK